MTEEVRTNEDCLKLLADYEQAYEKDLKEAKQRRNDRKSIALNKWAITNARFNVGDIIESQGTIIQVVRRYGRYSQYYGTKGLYVEYRGPKLTKKLQPRKDGERSSIYDDGREIKKVAGQGFLRRRL